MKGIASLAAAATCALVCQSALASNMDDPDNLTISLEGACPGRMTLHWEGAPASKMGAFCFAESLGTFTLPVGYCSGTVLGLGTRGLRLVAYFPLGPDGSGTHSGQADASACGGYVQMLAVVFGADCPVSNVVQLPQ